MTNYGDVTTAIQQAEAAGVTAGQQAAGQAVQAQQGVTTAQQGVTTAQQGVTTAQQAAAAAVQTLPDSTSQLNNDSGFQTAAIVFSATAISGGKIGLSTQGLVIGSSGHQITASNAIILDTTQGNNAISIYDGSTLRVKIGKL